MFTTTGCISPLERNSPRICLRRSSLNSLSIPSDFSMSRFSRFASAIKVSVLTPLVVNTPLVKDRLLANGVPSFAAGSRYSSPPYSTVLPLDFGVVSGGGCAAAKAIRDCPIDFNLSNTPGSVLPILSTREPILSKPNISPNLVFENR